MKSETKNEEEPIGFKPNILCFCCSWCSYAGANLAGVSRFQYPPTIRIVRVMCSGRVDPTSILEALKEEIDGILVTGCHSGNRYYLKGNEVTKEKIERFQKVLKMMGLEKRFKLELVSASEGKRFSELVTEFAEQIKELGPFTQ